MMKRCMLKLRKPAIRGALLALVPIALAIGQSTTASIAGKTPAMQQRTMAVPMPILYKHFFAHIRQLDNEADQLDKSGKDGSKHRRYYQQRLGFSNAQFGHVRDTAHNTQQADDIDQRAK